MKWNEKTLALSVFLIASLAFIGVALFSETLGEGGDSTTHYMYALLGLTHPAYFFVHWAKPLFTLLAAPFTLLGFTGMKLFNVLCSIGAAYLANGTAKEMGIKHWYWTAPAVLACPLLFPVTLSGLTEPFSALLLIASVYAYLKGHEKLGIVLASLLPFVRSEGLVILSVVAVLLLLKRDFCKLPLLLVGHVIFSLAGWYFYQDLLWVFTKIPYATTTSVYGSGDWFHFVNQLYFCLGPITFLGMCMGYLVQTEQWYRLKNKAPLGSIFLVHGISLAFVVAHSMFWALGIFNSMGLNRVLVSIFPLCGIIAIQGLSAITLKIPGIYAKAFYGFWVILLLAFPFFDNPASTRFNEAMRLTPEHVFMKGTLAPYLEKYYPTNRYLAAEPEIALFTSRDFFTKDIWVYPGTQLKEYTLHEGDVMIYDSIVMTADRGITLTQLRSEGRWKQDTVFTYVNNHRQVDNYYLFVHKANNK